MFKILENKMIVPNLHLATIAAGEIAGVVQPGQFVILRVEEDGERIPLTVSDWDREEGTITLVYLNIGKTTQKLAALPAGAGLPTVVGPARECDGNRPVWPRDLHRWMLRDCQHLPDRQGAERKRQPGHGPDGSAQLLPALLARKAQNRQPTG